MSSASKKPETRSTNGWDVCIRLIDTLYNLINSGNIIGCFVLYMCVQLFYLTTKLSESTLDKYMSKVFSYEYTYIAPLSVALIISLIANARMITHYRRQIQYYELQLSNVVVK